jgi:uncharacterized membrane protein
MFEALGMAWHMAKQAYRREVETRAGFEGTFVGIATGAVTLIIAIYVFSQIVDVMPTPTNSDLANSTNTTIKTAGSAFNLGAVALIVLVAAMILALVAGFGWRGREK